MELTRRDSYLIEISWNFIVPFATKVEYTTFEGQLPLSFRRLSNRVVTRDGPNGPSVPPGSNVHGPTTKPGSPNFPTFLPAEMAQPTFTLNDGNKIPFLAFGTGTSFMKRDVTEPASLAIENGFTHMDCAQVCAYNRRTAGSGI